MINDNNLKVDLVNTLKTLQEQIVDPANYEYISNHPEILERLNVQINLIKKRLSMS